MTKSSTGKKVGAFIVIAVVVFGIILFGLSISKNGNENNSGGKAESGSSSGRKIPKTEVDKQAAAEDLQKLLDEINVSYPKTRRAAISDEDILSDEEELPDIKAYPLSVTGNGQINIEIYSSPEKAGKGTDGWLNEVAENFNSQGITVNGKTASVSIRSVSSGLAVDYIRTGKYVPDALTPSNEFWGSMLESEGVDVRLVEKRIVGNTAGILVSKDKYAELIDKYGSVSMKVISDCTAKSEIAMGYTNPFASSTGLNFLVSTLYSYDASDLLSDKAIAGFRQFQENVPLVSYNTMQIRTSAESGTLDAFVMEYQSYFNDATLKNDYVFTAFGARHDNPMYAIGELSADKSAVLDEFCKFCLNSSSQQLASQYGFNENDKYKSELPEDIGGDKLLQAQKLYKANKDNGRPIAAVFVADVSGSMLGDSINALQTSLINSMQYINKENYIGLVSYNGKVYVNLPIAKFDINQQSFFKGAVQDLSASGQTATYDAIAVALDMVKKAQDENPDVKPMIFLLSDGEQNTGCSLNDISSILSAYEVPVYTIGYNANIDALKKVSSINEAATINADSDDIIYQLKNLFNSEM